MIGKIRTRTSVGSGGDGVFGDLAAYISHEAKALEIRYSPLILSVETAPMQMELTAQRRTRIKNPLFHHVLSWGLADKVSHDEIFGTVEGSLKALDFEPDRFQWVAAIHGDAAHQHAHVLTNRVSPIDSGVNSMSWSSRKLYKFCREQELAHGWSSNYGTYTINESGIAVIDKSRILSKASVSLAAKDGEIWTGSASFQRWVGLAPAEALKKALAVKARWSALHETLLEFNLEYRLFSHGEVLGGVIVDRDDDSYHAKASHLDMEFSLPALEKVLGPYQEPSMNLSFENRVTSYLVQLKSGQLTMAWVDDPQIKELHTKYQGVMDEWRTSGKAAASAAWTAVRDAGRARVAENRAKLKEAMMAVKVTTNPLPKPLLRAAFTGVYDEQLAEIRKVNKEERAAMRSSHRAPSSLFREWLQTQAKAGDTAAQAALRLIRSGDVKTGLYSHIQAIYKESEILAPTLSMEPNMDEVAFIEPGGLGPIMDDPKTMSNEASSLDDLDGYSETLRDPTDRVETTPIVEPKLSSKQTRDHGQRR